MFLKNFYIIIIESYLSSFSNLEGGGSFLGRAMLLCQK